MGLQATTVRLDDKLLDRVRAQSVREHRSMTATIVVALERFLDEVEAFAALKAQRKAKRAKAPA